MKERYTQLSKDTSIRYSVGCPVIIEASALLKDHQINRVLAQIKLKNLSDKTLSACKVRIKAYEPGGKEVEGFDSYNFLDLAVKCGESFGSKNPAILPNDGTRIIKVLVIEAVYSDGTVWNECESEWKILPDATPIGSVVGSEIKEQFRLESGISSADLVPQITDDLFVCPCGEIYKISRSACPKCGKSRETLLSLWDVDVLKKNSAYDLAKSKMGQNNIVCYETAINTFRTISGWKDADEQIVICQSKIEEIRAKEEADRLEAERRAQKAKAAAEKRTKKLKKAAAIGVPILVACIAFVIVLTTVIIPKQKLNKALGLMDSGDYDAAYALLEELGNSEAIASNKYDRAAALIDSGDYEAAYALLEEIGDRDAIASNKYDRAAALIDSGDYEAAYILLNGLNYKDSEARAEELLVKYETEKLKAAKVGDYVIFGSYEQDNDTSNGKEDIEWLVLAKEENKVLVISRYALDCKQYNTSKADVTWETCSLRKWLNGEFISNAFSTDEQNMIQVTTVASDKNPSSYLPTPKYSTTDRVFLLSITEANEYFGSYSARQCGVTAYAKSKGVTAINENGNCWWWLRTYGVWSYTTTYVFNGSVNTSGRSVDDDGGAVRPAMWITFGS